MLEEISIFVTVMGFLIGVIGHKNKKAVAIGLLLFFAGLLGIILPSL